MFNYLRKPQLSKYIIHVILVKTQPGLNRPIGCEMIRMAEQYGRHKSRYTSVYAMGTPSGCGYRFHWRVKLLNSGPALAPAKPDLALSLPVSY